MKKNYVTPELEFKTLLLHDVILTSTEPSIPEIIETTGGDGGDLGDL